MNFGHDSVPTRCKCLHLPLSDWVSWRNAKSRIRETSIAACNDWAIRGAIFRQQTWRFLSSARSWQTSLKSQRRETVSSEKRKKKRKERKKERKNEKGRKWNEKRTCLLRPYLRSLAVFLSRFCSRARWIIERRVRIPQAYVSLHAHAFLYYLSIDRHDNTSPQHSLVIFFLRVFPPCLNHVLILLSPTRGSRRSAEKRQMISLSCDAAFKRTTRRRLHS